MRLAKTSLVCLSVFFTGQLKAEEAAEAEQYLSGAWALHTNDECALSEGLFIFESESYQFVRNEDRLLDRRLSSAKYETLEGKKHVVVISYGRSAGDRSIDYYLIVGPNRMDFKYGVTYVKSGKKVREKYYEDGNLLVRCA